jgi:hypothetical protein
LRRQRCFIIRGIIPDEFSSYIAYYERDFLLDIVVRNDMEIGYKMLKHVARYYSNDVFRKFLDLVVVDDSYKNRQVDHKYLNKSSICTMISYLYYEIKTYITDQILLICLQDL